MTNNEKIRAALEKLDKAGAWMSAALDDHENTCAECKADFGNALDAIETLRALLDTPAQAEEVDRVGFRLIQTMGFSHSMSNGDHVVSGYGFSARHTSLGCIARRIGEYIAALQSDRSDHGLERLVQFCLGHSISTGHADDMDLLLDEVLPQFSSLIADNIAKDMVIARLHSENKSPARPVVKPLVWVDGEYLSSAWALGPVRYKAQFSVTGNAWDLFLGDTYLSEHGERDEAKAAAEAHWQRKIGECLV